MHEEKVAKGVKIVKAALFVFSVCRRLLGVYLLYRFGGWLLVAGVLLTFTIRYKCGDGSIVKI